MIKYLSVINKLKCRHTDLEVSNSYSDKALNISFSFTNSLVKDEIAKEETLETDLVKKIAQDIRRGATIYIEQKGNPKLH